MSKNKSRNRKYRLSSRFLYQLCFLASSVSAVKCKKLYYEASVCTNEDVSYSLIPQTLGEVSVETNETLKYATAVIY